MEILKQNKNPQNFRNTFKAKVGLLAVSTSLIERGKPRQPCEWHFDVGSKDPLVCLA